MQQPLLPLVGWARLFVADRTTLFMTPFASSGGRIVLLGHLWPPLASQACLVETQRATASLTDGCCCLLDHGPLPRTCVNPAQSCSLRRSAVSVSDRGSRQRNKEPGCRADRAGGWTGGHFLPGPPPVGFHRPLSLARGEAPCQALIGGREGCRALRTRLDQYGRHQYNGAGAPPTWRPQPARQSEFAWQGLFLSTTGGFGGCSRPSCAFMPARASHSGAAPLPVPAPPPSPPLPCAGLCDHAVAPRE